ncbi:MAG: hypothetical protein RJA98_2982 [Pseudomonadota bacterium]|jgi:putative membrane protein
MLLDALLAYAHWVALLTLAVFSGSLAALCRPEWLNEAALRRLQVINRVFWGAAGAVLLTGLARSVWGIHGAAWTWAQPLFHLKVSLFVLMLGLSLPPTRQLGRWLATWDATGELPPAAVVLHTRRAFMRASHLMLVLPLLGALVARGVWGR